MRRAVAIAIVLGGVVAAAQPASASSIFNVCGPHLCRLDAEGAENARVARASKQAFSSVSASRDGRRVAYVRGDVYVANRRLRRRRRIDAGALAYMSPDGKRVAYVKSVYTVIVPGTYFPCCTPAVYGYRLYLYVRRADGKGKARLGGTGAVTAGWLGNRVIRERPTSSERPRVGICLLAGDRCGRTVAERRGRDLSDPVGSPNRRFVAATSAAPPGRDGKRRLKGRIALFNARTGAHVRDLTRGRSDHSPAFSPDGRRIAFNRGRRLYVVPVVGGRAKLLRRNAASPAWVR